MRGLMNMNVWVFFLFFVSCWTELGLRVVWFQNPRSDRAQPGAGSPVSDSRTRHSPHNSPRGRREWWQDFFLKYLDKFLRWAFFNFVERKDNCEYLLEVFWKSFVYFINSKEGTCHKRVKWDKDNWWDKSDCPHFFPNPKHPGLFQQHTDIHNTDIQQNVGWEIKGIIGF